MDTGALESLVVIDKAFSSQAKKPNTKKLSDNIYNSKMEYICLMALKPLNDLV